MKRFLNRTGLCIICVWIMSISVSAARMLVPVGEVVGLELADHTVTVAAFHEELGPAAQKAGLKVGDRIVKINGTAVNSPEDIRYALDRAEAVVELTVMRGEKTVPIKIKFTIRL